MTIALSSTGKRWGVKALAALALTALVVMAAMKLPLGDLSLSLVEWVRKAGVAGIVVFGLAYVIASALLLPGSMLTLGAGFAYGPVMAVLLVSPISVLAATVAFLLARSVAREWVSQRVARDQRFEAIDVAVAESGFKIVTLLRLSPVLPFNLLNYALGLTRVRVRDYVFASWLGMLPGTVLYVYLGSLVTSASELASGTRPDAGPWGKALYWGGLLATVVATAVITRISKRSLQTALARVAAKTGRDDGASKFQAAEVLPDDVHNRELVSHVHPPAWQNPNAAWRYNLVVIGGGTAGLVSAMGAASLGARVALVERHLLGGDCLNYGCVPSKALIRAARAAYDARQVSAFGARAPEGLEVDFSAVMERMRRLRAVISHHDSAKRSSDAGVEVYLGDARFVSPEEVEVAGQRLRFARAVIATGARAAVPPIAGLRETGFLTNETIFSLTSLPRRLAVLGGGPIGCELAQAFRRFGAQVTLLSAGEKLLPKEDEDAAQALREQFLEEGIELILGAQITHVASTPDGKKIVFQRERGAEHKVVDEILVAIGRAPNVEGLGLELAGVDFDASGVRVDDRLMTKNPRIYAAGDICSPYKFTHAADAMARTVLQNALFMGRKKASSLVIPWATYTDPEIAHVGISAADAKARGSAVQTFTVPFESVDRAVLDGETRGFARLHVDAKNGQLLGATVVARHAGDLIGEVSLAMTHGLAASALSSTILPYPTQAEAWKRLGDAYNRTRLKPWVKRVFERYFAWRR